MIRIVPDIDKKFILDRLSQEEILERYLGIEVTFTDKVCSPFREDLHPTCTFRRARSGAIMFKDWSGAFYGDCFEVVKLQHNCSYWDACKIIARDFNLVEGIQVGTNFNRKPKTYEHKEKDEVTTIQVKWKDFSDYDRSYWRDHGITPETLYLFRVAPIRYAWVNGIVCYSYRPTDPAYAYKFGEKYKLYFPSRKDWRFLGNYKNLQGYDQLPEEGEVLVVTKSLKDVMFLYELGIPAVAPPSESSILTPEQYGELSERFTYIVCLYDFDLTGLRSANRMRREYGIPRVFLTNGRFGTKDYGGKDATDVAKRYGKPKAAGTIKELVWQGVQKMQTTSKTS